MLSIASFILDHSPVGIIGDKCDESLIWDTSFAHKNTESIDTKYFKCWGCQFSLIDDDKMSLLSTKKIMRVSDRLCPTCIKGFHVPMQRVTVVKSSLFPQKKRTRFGYHNKSGTCKKEPFGRINKDTLVNVKAFLMYAKPETKVRSEDDISIIIWPHGESHSKELEDVAMHNEAWFESGCLTLYFDSHTGCLKCPRVQ